MSVHTERNGGARPVRCGCGGEAKIDWALQPDGVYITGVYCENCGTNTIPFWGKEKDKAIDYAVTTWNRAMGNRMELQTVKERTAKVEEAVPNMTILKRKVDLLSILQAIKSDKIRVWMNYDGKICFQNTKTGNEISVEPYYDMEGNTNNE